MAWMTITKFQKTFAEGSRPARNTVKAWIEKKEVYGRKFGGQWYVDPDVNSYATDNELVLRVLREA